MKTDKARNILLILLLVALNIIIKSIFIGVNNIDIDEPFTIYYSQGSLKDLVSFFQSENNPPLFFVLLHFWIKIFGIGPASVRFLPMLFSSLAVVFIYLIGKKHYSVFVALGASLLYTFSNLNIMEAHDTRVYGLFVFLTTASMYAYLSIVSSGTKRKYLIALTILNILLVYSHLFGFFVVLLQVITTLIFPSVRKKVIKLHIWSSILLFLFYLPYFIYIIPHMLNAVNVGRPFPKSEILHLFYVMWTFTNYDYYSLLVFLGAIIMFYITCLLTKSRLSEFDKIIFSWAFIPYLLMFIISYKIGIAIPKYMIFISPGFYLVAMISIYFISTNARLIELFSLKKYTNALKIFGICIMFICIVRMISTSDLKSSNYSGSSEVVSIIKSHKSDSTMVFLIPSWISITVAYYYDLNAFKDVGNIEKRLSDNQIYMLRTPEDISLFDFAKATDILLVGGESNGLDFIDPEKKLFTVFVHKFGPAKVLAKLPGYTIYHFGSISQSVQ